MPSTPVLILGGPTGVGKSSLAIDLAQAWSAAVVSADAMTVFRGLDVGTAKPTAAEQAAVPHWGLDLVDPPEAFTVADFVAVLQQARGAHERVIVAGGTPFYLRSIVQPLAPMPAADPVVRAQLEQLEDPHAALALVDPPSAARLHAHDRVRVLRALEVHALTGRPMSEVHRDTPSAPLCPFVPAWLDPPDLPEGWLRERIGQRLKQMLGQGYLEEARQARARWGAGCKPLRSFAYTHLLAHLDGELDLAEALRRTERDTWRLARKQRSWARALGWERLDPAGVARHVQRAWGP